MKSWTESKSGGIHQLGPLLVVTVITGAAVVWPSLATAVCHPRTRRQNIAIRCIVQNMATEPIA